MMGMPRCRDVARAVASDELARKPWHARLASWVHLLMCRHCLAFAEQIRAIGRIARELYGDSGPAPNGSSYRAEM
jgi:hypothetical protein